MMLSPEQSDAMYAAGLRYTDYETGEEICLRKRRAKRKPTRAGMVRLAMKLGATTVTVAPDGSVTMSFGETRPALTNELDQWIAKQHAH